MISNLTKYIPTILVFFFIFAIFYFYNSEINKKNDLQKNLIFHNLLKEKEESLIIVENDTNDILDFKSDVENYLKKKKKRYFWNLLK
tara:strand:- start:6467 stop:6727 length:261 start_codon:yes stop_codon:yes gene_type:complete